MDQNDFDQPTENDKELIAFVVEHCDRWRDYRNVNFLPLWEEYERIFRGEWAIEDKTRDSERSRIVTPMTQQAVETRHAEIMEAIFGSGELADRYFGLARPVSPHGQSAPQQQDASHESKQQSLERAHRPIAYNPGRPRNHCAWVDPLS